MFLNYTIDLKFIYKGIYDFTVYSDILTKYVKSVKNDKIYKLGIWKINIKFLKKVNE